MMPDALELTMGVFESNVAVIKRNTSGMTDGEAMLAPGTGGSNLLWILGHILQHRDEALKLLGGEPTLSADQAEHYKTGTRPSRVPIPLTLVQLLQRLDDSQERLAELAVTRSAPSLSSVEPDGSSILARLHGLAWHETYHAGQTGSLRRAAGLPGAIG